MSSLENMVMEDDVQAKAAEMLLDVQTTLDLVRSRCLFQLILCFDLLRSCLFPSCSGSSQRYFASLRQPAVGPRYDRLNHHLMSSLENMVMEDDVQAKAAEMLSSSSFSALISSARASFPLAPDLLNATLRASASWSVAR
jgi:hypothetical protein